MNTGTRKTRLGLLRGGCFVLLVPSFLAWWVNVEVAVRVFAPGWIVLERLMPDVLFRALSVLSADLSTISTLVPLLLLVFPFVMARRVMQFGEDASDRLRRLVYDPYPPHFPFFLVMLGLAGTLYGMLIGLEVSGVGDLGDQIASAESIQESLDRLLDGTATALLSSLVGLTGAFLAARPFTWIFHRAALMPAEDEPFSLSDTLQHLIEDMKTLGEASRAFGEKLTYTEIQEVPETLKQIQQELCGLREELGTANERIDVLGEGQTAGQALLEPLTQLSELQRLGSLEGLLTRLGDAQDTGNAHREQVVDLLHQGNRQQLDADQQSAEALASLQRSVSGIEGLLRDLSAQSEDGLRKAGEQRSQVISLLGSAQADRREDRQSIRSAVGQFLDGSMSPPPGMKETIRHEKSPG